jgi:hypothetical protein
MPPCAVNTKVVISLALQCFSPQKGIFPPLSAFRRRKNRQIPICRANARECKV